MSYCPLKSRIDKETRTKWQLWRRERLHFGCWLGRQWTLSWGIDSKLERNSIAYCWIKFKHISLCRIREQKSRIRETKHLSTDADSSTNTTVGWTKNSQKPNFFEKPKKSPKTKKTQKRPEICQNLRYTLRPEVSHPSGIVVFNMFCTAKSAKKNFFCAAILDHFQTKMFKSETTSFRYFSPRIPNL